MKNLSRSSESCTPIWASPMVTSKITNWCWSLQLLPCASSSPSKRALLFRGPSTATSFLPWCNSLKSTTPSSSSKLSGALLILHQARASLSLSWLKTRQFPRLSASWTRRLTSRSRSRPFGASETFLVTMWDLEMLFLTRIYYLKSASLSTAPPPILHLCATQSGLLPTSARESQLQISTKLCVASLRLLRSLTRPTRRRSSTTSSGHCLTSLMRAVMSESKSSFSATSFPD